MNNISIRLVLFAFTILLSITSASVNAGVVMYGTRIIYTEHSDFKLVRLANHDKTPNLMQVWVDNGDGKPSNLEADNYFTVTPPLFRINSNGQQTVKIIAEKKVSTLPKERESLFWFNFLQIPTASNEPQKNNSAKITISFLNQVKMIYRPSKIQGSVSDLWKNIKFSISTRNGKTYLQASNPTGYYATFVENAVLESAGAKHVVLFNKNVTLSPFSTLNWEVAGKVSAGSTLVFSLIDDYGNAKVNKVTL